MRKGIIQLFLLALVVALMVPTIACQREEPAEIEMEMETPPAPMDTMEEGMEEMGEGMEEMGDEMEDMGEEMEDMGEEMEEEEPPPPVQ